MLARTAEQMYWIGRYLERIENTARMVSVNSSLMMDLPRGIKVGWEGLVIITGSNEQFLKQYQRMEERNVVKFMLADRLNPGSVYTSISFAREGARICREIIPSESWEQINKLYLHVRNQAEAAVKRENRDQFLQEIILHCQQITGIFTDGMSHDLPYYFLNIGRYIERADMTTRIIDVGAVDLLPAEKKTDELTDTSPYESVMWMNVLKSLSGYQMYRQYVKDRVNGEDVVIFLLQDLRFPRSVAYCISKLTLSFRQLPRFEAVTASTTRLQRSIRSVKVEKMIESGLPEYIDRLQRQIANVHVKLNETWFGPVELN